MTTNAKLALRITRIVITASLIWALHEAQAAGLISSSLQIPLSYFGFAYLGWWMNKAVRLYRSRYKWKHKK